MSAGVANVVAVALPVDWREGSEVTGRGYLAASASCRGDLLADATE